MQPMTPIVFPSRSRRAWARSFAAAAVAGLMLGPLGVPAAHAAETANAAADAPNAANAANESPETLILNLSNEILDTIRSDKAIQAGDFNHLQKLVNERILPHVDFDKITRLTVGRPWRTATAEQRGMLIEQFRLLLLRTYSGALSRISDQKVRLRPSRGQDSGGDDVIVRTQIVSSQGDPIGLDYRLEKTASGWKIYDLNILGVWLVENYKNEFLGPLNEGGVERLIQVLVEKNRKVAAGAAKSS